MVRSRATRLIVAVWCVPALLMTLPSYVYDSGSDTLGAAARAALRQGCRGRSGSR
ncbi:MAG TPA: hypothetical protein VFT22_04230 [Kofleriaceae bacterium]|nr:hypothetical protein [Kofleriaceae bacterium]